MLRRDDAPIVKYVLDRTWCRVSPGSVLAGSPMRMFRVRPAGERVLDLLSSGAEVEPSALVDRLRDAGAIHPLPETSAAPRRFTAADVTVVTPQLGGVVRDDGRITVDDGSTPPLLGASVRLPVNRGPGAARNAGRSLVHTPLIAFVDADVETDRSSDGGPRSADGSWLDALLAHFDDEAVGLVAPRVTGDPRSSLDLGTEPARIRSGTRVSYVPAAAIIVRARAFDAIGGFDETLRFGEDVDMVWRLDQAGWSCRYEPRSTVWHRPRSTWRARALQQVGYGSSSAPLALRHPTRVAPFDSDAVSTGVWASAAAGHPLVALVLAIGNVVATTRRLPLPTPIGARLAVRSQIDVGRQLATGVRRAWWPIVAVAAVTSRRARRVLFVAAAMSPSTTVTDVAFGWGTWVGMIGHRSWRPILPRIALRISRR